MAVFIVVLLSLFGVSLQPKNSDDLRSSLDNPNAPLQVAMLKFVSNEDVGPYNRSQDVFVIEQRYYSRIGEDFLIHDLQLPIVYQPRPDDNSSVLGWGDFDYRVLFTTLQTGPLKWGVGGIFEVPMGSDPLLTTKKWSAGLALAVVYQPWGMSLGGNLRQKWSFAGDGSRPDVNLTEVDPIVKIYIGEKTTVGMLDTIRVDWNQEGRSRWTIPVGAEIGQYFKYRNAGPMNLRFGIFENTVRPDNSSDWYWRISAEFVQ